MCVSVCVCVCVCVRVRVRVRVCAVHAISVVCGHKVDFNIRSSVKVKPPIQLTYCLGYIHSPN